MNGDLVEVISEILGGASDSLTSLLARVVIAVFPYLGSDVLRPGPAVELDEPEPLVRVGHDEELPALTVPSRGSLDGHLDASCDQRERNGSVEVDPFAHRPCGGKDFISVH